MNKTATFLLILLLLVPGCASKKEIPHQKLPLEDEWDTKTHHISTSKNIEKSQKEWWKSFKDPQLDNLIKLAIENNLDNKIAIARIKQARADRAVTRSGLFPNVDVSQTARSSEKIGTSIGNSRTDLINGELDLSWEIDFFGQQRHLTKSSYYSTKAYESDHELIMLTLVSDLISGYIEHAKNIELIKINIESIEEHKHALDLVKSKHLSGVSDSLEVEEEQALLIQTESKLNDLKAEAKRSLYRISTLCGRQPGQLSLDETKLYIPKVKKKIFLDTPLSILRKRPDIKKAEYMLLSSTSATHSAIASQYPQISIGSTIGYQNSNTTPASTSWSLAQSMLMPLINFGKIKQTIRSQEAQEEQSFLSYQKHILSALEEVETTLASYDTSRKNHENAIRIKKSRAHILDMTKHLYENKLKSYKDVINAKKDFLTSKTKLAEKSANISTNAVKLYKALGYTIS